MSRKQIIVRDIQIRSAVCKLDTCNEEMIGKYNQPDVDAVRERYNYNILNTLTYCSPAVPPSSMDSCVGIITGPSLVCTGRPRRRMMIDLE